MSERIVHSIQSYPLLYASFLFGLFYYIYWFVFAKQLLRPPHIGEAPEPENIPNHEGKVPVPMDIRNEPLEDVWYGQSTNLGTYTNEAYIKKHGYPFPEGPK